MEFLIVLGVILAFVYVWCRLFGPEWHGGNPTTWLDVVGVVLILFWILDIFMRGRK